jgi:exonuclease III
LGAHEICKKLPQVWPRRLARLVDFWLSPWKIWLPGPVRTSDHTALPGDSGDTQSRYIEAAVNGVLIGTLYAPDGNPQPGPKFSYKLIWMERLITHAAELYAPDAPGVLAGDYNVVPTDADIYPTKSYKDNALVQPQPRALFRRLLDQGLFARCTPTLRCTPSGITFVIAGSAMPGSGSITCS